MENADWRTALSFLVMLIICLNLALKGLFFAKNTPNFNVGGSSL